MTPMHFLFCAIALAGLSACASGSSDLGALGEPAVTRLNQAAPPGAEPGTCWGKHVTPAIIETVTHQIMVQPPQMMSDGTITQPAIYKTETRQEIVRDRHETWFQTPCAATMTPEFTASVQRALKARGLYRREITGEMDTHTRAAVRRFQKPEGLDSGILSLATARKLGLVAVEMDAQG